VSSGLRDAGFSYINLDAGVWQAKRGPHDEIVEDKNKFPSGSRRR
jgi:hypothetical protein